MREFETGATRNSDTGKLDYEGFFSPLVLKRRAEYMHKHRVQANGQLRASDNWQKGIPITEYIKSGWRHFHDWWAAHRGNDVDIEEAICALMFNAEGYLHELLKAKQGPSPNPLQGAKTETYAEWAARVLRTPRCG